LQSIVKKKSDILNDIDPDLLAEHYQLKMKLQQVDSEIRQLTQELAETEKSNLELRSFIESKREKEERAKKNTEKIEQAIQMLEMMRRSSVKKEDYFNREVCDHHNCFTCDF
jgi:chromosome segregation ATPase